MPDHPFWMRRSGQPPDVLFTMPSAPLGGALITATVTLLPLLGRVLPPLRWPPDILATSLGTHVALVAAFRRAPVL
jgi:hypothetical protein